MRDNDLIRRDDAMRIMSDGDDIVGPDYPEWFINRYATINAIPAVQPTVSPDVATLVEAVMALEVACFGEVEDVFAGEIGEEMKAIRAALARVKGVM